MSKEYKRGVTDTLYTIGTIGMYVGMFLVWFVR